MKKAIIATAVLAAFLLLAMLYLWPATYYTIAQNHVAGLGEDGTAMPYFFWWLRETARIAPLNLLNPQIYGPQLGAPEGFYAYIPFAERILGLLSTPFSTPDQALFYSIAGQYATSGALAAWLGRRMGLDWILAFGLGICTAFTPYTHVRALTQPGFTGVFFLPLLMLAYDYLRTARAIKDAIVPSLLLLASAASAHYFILIMLTLFAVPAFFLWRAWHTTKHSSRALIALAALVPLVLALGWLRFGPEIGISHIKKHQPLVRNIFETYKNRGWDLLVYSARPVDYLAGSHAPDAWDPNPLRKTLTRHVRSRDPNWYMQERSSGIRWLILLSVIPMLAFRKRFPPGTRHWIIFGLVFAATAYAFSLSPRCISPLGIGIGPSRWVHALFPEMRAPNRWSIAVAAGLAVSYFALVSWLLGRIRSVRWRTGASLLVVALVILESPPTLRFPHYKAVAPIERGDPCGLGIYFPYWRSDNMAKYQYATAMRQSSCQLANLQRTPWVDKYLHDRLGEQVILSNSGWSEARRVIGCLGIGWVRIEDEHLARGPAICKKLGFTAFEGIYCERPRRALMKMPNSNPWTECLK
ncbi:MAG: hypothetical protein A2583_14450 [Bdellovibrionales bacterium RIFOXYD1_FULL_53_11]|nr:MAG: hypothetical protein A2583_14450 [Bdellovibrionales bacterium RIFOXYD1_FULL_53_11]